MLTKLRTVFPLQQLIICKVVQFLQLVKFSLLLLVACRWLLPEVVVSAISLLDLQNHQLKQTEPRHQSAVPSFSLSTHLLHHSELA